jgi:putative peptide zinc metalloprotease protein
LILGRIALRFLRGLGRWSEGSLVRRVAATALSAVLLTSLSAAWWPDAGTYRPIEPGERGLLTSLLPVQPTTITEPGDRMGAAARTRLAHGGPLVAAFEKGKPLPTKDDPALAVVLVPTGTSGSGDPVTPGTGSDDLGPDANETWVFPFDEPLPPAEGDTQALAVATQDGSVVYDLAFALVWADGDEVLNVNEAHAYASCSNCVAVAVAFQVVLIVDDAQVVVPQNLAVAATYDCYQCITAAIASQLVLTVQAEPREEDLRALAGVWNRLLALAQEITSIPLAEVSARLEAFKTEIVDILADAPPLTPPTSTSPTTTPSPITTPSPTTTGSPTEQPTDSSPAATPAPEPPPPSAPPSPTDSTPSTPGAPPPEETAPAPSEPAPDTGTSGETGSPTPAPTDAPSPTGSP